MEQIWNVRRRLHKLYYQYKPDKYYWVLIVVGRKFLLCVTSLMFKKNPTFQLSMALLIMFVAYVFWRLERHVFRGVQRYSEVFAGVPNWVYIYALCNKCK